MSFSAGPAGCPIAAVPSSHQRPRPWPASQWKELGGGFVLQTHCIARCALILAQTLPVAARTSAIPGVLAPHFTPSKPMARFAARTVRRPRAADAIRLLADLSLPRPGQSATASLRGEPAGLTGNADFSCRRREFCDKPAGLRCAPCPTANVFGMGIAGITSAHCARCFGGNRRARRPRRAVRVPIRTLFRRGAARGVFPVETPAGHGHLKGYPGEDACRCCQAAGSLGHLRCSCQNGTRNG